MKSRVRIVLVSILAVLLLLGLVGLLSCVVSLSLDADIEPIPAPGRGAVSEGAVRRPVPARRAPEEVVGVGLAVHKDARDGVIRIMQIISNSPAFRAGLQRGWIVDKIDDRSTADEPLSECVARLRGPVGTKVRLEVTSPDLERTNVVELTRQRLRL